MQTRELTDEEALILSQKEEGQFFDKKDIKIDGKGIQKIAVALANSEGGDFLIGIIDDKHEADPHKRWAGFSSLEDINPCLQNMLLIQPSIDFKYEFLKCQNKVGYVLRIQIEKSSHVHKTGGEIVYIRLGAQSIQLRDPQRITDLSFAKGTTTYEDAKLTDVNPDDIVYSNELAKFLSEYSPKTDPLDYALNQNIIDSKTYEPRVAGTLLFHPSPTGALPKKCAIKIARYTTKEDDPERDHLEEIFTLESPLYNLIHLTINKLSEIMSNIKVWSANGLKNMEFPPEAVWETVVNAVIHRDYSISDDVQIFIYDNRVEITSPGKLPGYVTAENILEARFSRNPKIVRTLNWYKDPPNKDLGEGLNTTFQKMKEWKLKDPIIEETGNYVKVTLPHVPLASPSEAILKFLLKERKITNMQARDITGIKSENLVKIEFYTLRDKKFIERVPGLKGPASAWQLTKDGEKYANNEYGQESYG